jgi:hypothetical protein
MSASDPGCVKPWKQSSARNKRIKSAVLANDSNARGIFLESILRPNDPHNGFHTAKTLTGHRS